MGWIYRDYKCLTCMALFEAMVKSGEERELQECKYCGIMASELMPVASSGYKINGDNSASTKPKGGAYKRGRT